MSSAATTARYVGFYASLVASALVAAACCAGFVWLRDERMHHLYSACFGLLLGVWLPHPTALIPRDELAQTVGYSYSAGPSSAVSCSPARGV